MKGVRITVTKDGQVTVVPYGVSGPACQDLTREIEKSLGSVEQTEKTADFYAAENVGEQEQSL